jgi:hypothetical protein
MGISVLGAATAGGATGVQLVSNAALVTRGATASANATQVSLYTASTDDLFTGWSATSGNMGSSQITASFYLNGALAAQASYLNILTSNVGSQVSYFSAELAVPVYIPAGSNLTAMISYSAPANFTAHSVYARTIPVSALRTF